MCAHENFKERYMPREENYSAQGWCLTSTCKYTHMSCQNTEMFSYQILLPWYVHLLMLPLLWLPWPQEIPNWHHRGHQTMPSCCSTSASAMAPAHQTPSSDALALPVPIYAQDCCQLPGAFQESPSRGHSRGLQPQWKLIHCVVL